MNSFISSFSGLILSKSAICINSCLRFYKFMWVLFSSNSLNPWAGSLPSPKKSLANYFICFVTVADENITYLGPAFKYYSNSFLMFSSAPLSIKVSNSSITNESKWDRNSFWPSRLCCILSKVLTNTSTPWASLSVSIVWFCPG